VVLVCPGAEVYLCSGGVFDPKEDHCETRYTVSNVTSTSVGATTDNNGIPLGTAQTGAVSGSVTGYKYGVIAPSLCGTAKYDSRSQFCDKSDSTSTNKDAGATVRNLCGGKYGKEYREGAGSFLWNEKCEDGNVTRSCGTGSNAKRYVLGTQFCESSSTGSVKDRCGTPNSSGIYTVGKYNVSNNIDRTWENTGSRSAGLPIKGEYSTANGEICVDGKVVKLCGTKQYEEQTHFCAVGDVIAPHCTDRQIYDPSTQYCSFMGNSYNTAVKDPYYPGYPSGTTQTISGNTPLSKERNIQQRTADGFYNYYGTSDECKPNTSDLTGTGCMQYASTAIEFCGAPTGTPAVYGVANKPNEGAWRWEYCRDMDLNATTSDGLTATPHTAASKGSIIRCAELQVPPTGTGNTCQCIVNAIPISTTTNGCKCVAGWKFDGSTVTGRFNNNGKPVQANDIAEITNSGITSYSLRYDGGACYPVFATTSGAAPSCESTEILWLNADSKYECRDLATTKCPNNTLPVIQGYIGTKSLTGFNAGATYACVAEAAPSATIQEKVNALCGTTGTNTRIVVAASANLTPSISEHGAICVDKSIVDAAGGNYANASVYTLGTGETEKIFKCTSSSTFKPATGTCE